jgi:hypothetical protein
MTIVDVLKKYPGDFAAARLNQTDIGDGTDDDLAAVSARSNMFRDCVGKAMHK